MPWVGSVLLATALTVGCAPLGQRDAASVEVSTGQPAAIDTLDAVRSATPTPSVVPDATSLPAAPQVTNSAPPADPLLTPPAAPAPPVSPLPGSPAKTTATRSPSAAAPRTTPQTAVAPAAVAAATSTAYSVHANADGSLARWDPCRPIHYRLNLTGATDGAAADAREALRRVAEVTGMSFVDDGTTDVVPTNDWLKNSTDDVLVIAWSARSASDLFSDGADGVGGWWEVGTSRGGGAWVWRIVRGFVVIDIDKTRGYAAGFGTGATRGALLMHELAHAVGLGHVEDPGQIMNPFIGRSTQAAWGAGDLAGLALVGRAAGCLAG